MVTGAGDERPASGRQQVAVEDAEARHWLGFLRSGTPAEKAEARIRLAPIFERRGMLPEAIELLETNGRAGVRDPALFTRLADLYRLVGRDDDADAALAEVAVVRVPIDGLGTRPTRSGAYSARASVPTRRTPIRRAVRTPATVSLVVSLIGVACAAVLWLALSLGGGRADTTTVGSQKASAPVAPETLPTPLGSAPAPSQPTPAAAPAYQPNPAASDPLLAATVTPAGEPISAGPDDPLRQAYAAAITPPLLAAGTSTERMSELAKRAGDDPQLLLDASWKRDMMAILADIRTAGTALRQQRAVPSSAVDLDGTLAGLGTDLAYVADEMQAGIDGPNARRLQNALTRTHEVNARLPVLERQLDALRAG